MMGMSSQDEEHLERLKEMCNNNICGGDRYIPSVKILQALLIPHQKACIQIRSIIAGDTEHSLSSIPFKHRQG